MNFIDKRKSPCINCKIHVLGYDKETRRCGECPDRIDFLTGIEGGHPCCRQDNPLKEGFEEYDAVAALANPDAYKPVRKTCSKCGESFTMEEVPFTFFRDRKTADGFMGICKTCSTDKRRLERDQRKKEELNYEF